MTATIATGPWTKQAELRLPPAERAAAIRDVLMLRRLITRASAALELERQAKRQLLRMIPGIKRSGYLPAMKTAKEYLTELTEVIERREVDIAVCAEHLLLALTELQNELTDHEAGALLGIHHVHVQRQGGALLKAAVKPPVVEAVADALMDQIIKKMMADPIQHRKARGMLNNLLNLDLPLPDRPRPTAV